LREAVPVVAQAAKSASKNPPITAYICASVAVTVADLPRRLHMYHPEYLF
jgi:hypothetical protein